MQDDIARLTAAAEEHWSARRFEDALAAAWEAYDRDPGDIGVKQLVTGLVFHAAKSVTPDRADAILRLLSDPQVDPDRIAAAGWHCAKRHPLFAEDAKADAAVMAARLEDDALAQALLRETLAVDHAVEAELTRLRRWLLLSGRWRDFPKCVSAFAAQAALNGGAWLFEDDERQVFTQPGAEAIAAAYEPERGVVLSGRSFGGGTTQAVARQYELWPYPVWSRIMALPPQRSLADMVRRLDPKGPQTMPAAPQVLVAGCGTGREPAFVAQRYSEASITAIDLSESSLRFAAERNAGKGIDFRVLDLYRVAELERRFDAIFSSGVLHHLPDPEGGLAALTAVLKPGGVMRIMLYSKMARLPVRAHRKLIADLIEQPVDADLLRAVRRRVMVRARAVPVTADFFSLSGVHDLLMHRHEDPFDVARIKRALETQGLELIAFELPDRAARAEYLAAYPGDPGFRSFANWQQFELRKPGLFDRMYGFWCRKPV